MLTLEFFQEMCYNLKFYGIGLPTEKHKEKSKESAHLVNFILGVNSDRSVEVLYNPKKIVL